MSNSIRHDHLSLNNKNDDRFVIAIYFVLDFDYYLLFDTSLNIYSIQMLHAIFSHTFEKTIKID